MTIGKFHISASVLIGIALGLFILISLIIRIVNPYNGIVSNGAIKFASNDAYYYERLVDNQAHNFPHLTKFDPFFIYPGGNHIGGTLFFVWIQALVCWVIGLGHPSQHLINAITIYFPPVLAALTVIPVFFIGRSLFNRWVGLIGAGLIAIMPGEFMGRTILGANDTPGAEVFFSTMALAFLIWAIKTAVDRNLTVKQVLKFDRKVVIKPLVLSVLAGLFLGLYLNSWFGGLMFVGIITIYLLVQFIINHIKRKSSQALGIVSIVTFLVTVLVFLPFSPAPELTFALWLVLLIPIVLLAGSMWMRSKNFNPWLYPASLAALVVIAIFIARAAFPADLSALWSEFRFVFFPSGSTAVTTQEMQPILHPEGTFTGIYVWGNFTTSFFLFKTVPIPGFAMIGFLIMVIAYLRRRLNDQQWMLFIVWAVIMFWAMLVQRRFAYYFVIDVVVLSAYVSWLVIWEPGLKHVQPKPELIPVTAKAQSSKEKRKQRARKQTGLNIYHINGVLAIICVFFFVAFFNLTKSINAASGVPYAPSDAWQSALTWMKDNTPEPLGTDGYYNLYENPPAGQQFQYPDTVYGVTSWWDYGYWISAIAHRIPNDTPSQEPSSIKNVASLFLSQDPATAQPLITKMKSKYVVIDFATATARLILNTVNNQVLSDGKFWAVLNWSDKNQSNYYDVFYVDTGTGQYVPRMLYYPDFYRSLVIRLFNFDGKAVTNTKAIVITYQNMTQQGHSYKVVTASKSFSTYEDAQNWVNSQPSGNYAIVGEDPFTSPVTLDAVPGYSLVYASEQTDPISNNATVPEVKIFEYNGP